MDPTVESVMEVANDMMWITLLLSLPILITALVVGVVISLIQTVTSVQEMTLTFVPKLIAVMAVIAFAMPWTLRTIIEYTNTLFRSMSTY